jgi:hypothetical protein
MRTRVKITNASQEPKNDVLNDVPFATDTASLLVINVEMESRMEFLKSYAKVLVPFKISVNNHTIVLAAKLCLKTRNG